MMHRKRFMPYDPKRSGAIPLQSGDGSTILTYKDAILERWTEHFNSVLNRPSSANENTINRLPQIGYNVLLDEFPTVTETRKAMQLWVSIRARSDIRTFVSGIRIHPDVRIV